MSLLSRIAGLLRPEPPPAPPAPPAPVRRRAAVAGVSSGRPSYAGLATTTLPWPLQYDLLRRFYQSVPALGRAVDILSGFAGTPQFRCEKDADTEELQAWADAVLYGSLGRSLDLWCRDHRTQRLIYGFGVGEAVIAANRREVEKLWSYKSSSHGFETDQAGSLQVLQQQSVGRVPLNPETVLHTVHNPQACDPHGQSLFFAVGTFAQVWLDVVHAHRATWRRNGIITFHVNSELDDSVDDPAGSEGDSVLSQMESCWNESMRSQVMDGRAKDFFSSGKVTVTSIGHDMTVMDISISKRAVVEEIGVGVGIPAWMLGYTWSTTERLSQQQADTLTSTVNVIRTEEEGTLRKLVDLRQRLAGRRPGIAYEIVWPASSLQDLVEQARAELFRAQTQEAQERVAARLWLNGIYGQQQYAEAVTGEATVITAMPQPVALPPGAQPPAAALSVVPALTRSERIAGAEAEAEREYPVLRHAPDCHCGRKLSADDPAQLFPSEEPQYEALTEGVQRVWRETRRAFRDLREDWFEAAGLAEPGRAMPAGASKELDPLAAGRVQAAIDRFLREFAGQDRTEAGFVSQDAEDGILQQAEYLSYSIGWQRGVELTAIPRNLELLAAQREALLRDAFARMSQDGRLRFETRLDEIRDAMAAGFDRGDNPLAIARQLGRGLDGYEQGRLRTICRTEMGIASEAGLREQYQAAGVTQVTILGDVTTDALCTSRIGNAYAVTDLSNQPPYHPQCFCSAAPLLPESGNGAG